MPSRRGPHGRRFGTAVLGIAIVVALLAPSALAAERRDVSFAVFGQIFPQERLVTERGPNVAVVEWFFGLGGVMESDTPMICCDWNSQLHWVWNTNTEQGTVSSPISFAHFLEPIHWVGEFRGHMTSEGGEGILHMTEMNSGMKVTARWTSEPVDPLVDEHITIEFTGTLTE
jgi:hypothetical protein